MTMDTTNTAVSRIRLTSAEEHAAADAQQKVLPFIEELYIFVYLLLICSYCTSCVDICQRMEVTKDAALLSSKTVHILQVFLAGSKDLCNHGDANHPSGTGILQRHHERKR